MFVICHEYQVQDADIKLSRVLPRPTWIKSNIEMSKMDALLAAAHDGKIAFHEERTARPQNNSHHSSLPGMDVLPAAAKGLTIDEERTAGPQDNSHSSLPGMDVLPVAAKDREFTIDEERAARPQNNSHYSSLPGMDVLPAAAKDREFAFDEERTAGPQNNSHRPLPATKYPIDEKKTLPVAAKNQKKKNAPNKKKQQPRNNNSTYTTASGYLNPSDSYFSSGQGYEWGMCDKDCGWCGRCESDYGHLL
jgi:hypothetical protein